MAYWDCQRYQHSTQKHVPPFKSNQENNLSTSTMSLCHPIDSARKALMLPPLRLALELQSHTELQRHETVETEFSRGEVRQTHIINAVSFLWGEYPVRHNIYTAHEYQLLSEVVFILLLWNKFMQKFYSDSHTLECDWENWGLQVSMFPNSSHSSAF